RGARQPFAVRREGEASGAVLAGRNLPQLPPRGRVPEPHARVVDGTGGEHLAVGREGETLEAAHVPFRREAILPRGHVPQEQRLVPPPGERFAIWCEGERTHPL